MVLLTQNLSASGSVFMSPSQRQNEVGGAYELLNTSPSQWAEPVRFSHPSEAQFLLLILTRTVLLLLLGETLSCAEVKMKHSVVICLLVCSSLVGLGSAIRCYSCKDYTASCTKQRDCSYDDACLTLVERGGMTYRKCLKYTECERSRLAQMFPQVSSFTFRCCNSDLCNSAPSSAASSVIGLLASVLVMWWCVH